MKSSLYVPKNTARSSLLQLIDFELTDYVNLSSDQTVNGSKTFNSPMILTNTAAAIDSTSGALRCAGGAYFGAGCLFGSYLTTTNYFGLYLSNVTNCFFGSFPAGGGGRVFIDTQSSSGFNGTIALPSLAAAATYTLPSASCTLLGNTGFTIPSGSITLTNGTFNSTASGSAAACAYSVGGVGNGMYSGAANQLNLAQGGVVAATFASNHIQLHQRVRLTSGDAAGPGLTFSADGGQDSGLYWISDGRIGFSANTVLRWDYNTTRILTTIPIHLPNGDVSNPSLAFASDGGVDTGFYWISDGNIGVSCNNGNVATFSTSGLRAVGIGGNTGKRIRWMDQGAATGTVNVANGGTGSLTITFSSAAPTTSGLVVFANPFGGSGLDRLTYGVWSLSTTGATIAIRNNSGADATSIEFYYVAYVFA